MPTGAEVTTGDEVAITRLREPQSCGGCHWIVVAQGIGDCSLEVAARVKVTIIGHHHGDHEAVAATFRLWGKPCISSCGA